MEEESIPDISEDTFLQSSQQLPNNANHKFSSIKSSSVIESSEILESVGVSQSRVSGRIVGKSKKAGESSEI